MKMLQAGDVRKVGDLQRRKAGSENDYTWQFIKENKREFDYHPITLVGHTILAPDLFVMEFKRP